MQMTCNKEMHFWVKIKLAKEKRKGVGAIICVGNGEDELLNGLVACIENDIDEIVIE